MEFTGKTVGTGVLGNETTITFTVNEKSEIIEEYYKLKDCEKLDICVTKHREKRSNDANKYFHVISDKIAEKLTISKAKSKNLLICKYGQPEILPDGNVMIYKTNAPVEYMEEQEFIHCAPIKFLDDAVFYKVYRGSSSYNTAEMSLLIDGAVADANELKIQTLTPKELQQMKERWGL